MMKILFILEYYYPNIGGVETFFKGLAESLVKRGHKCIVITSRLENTKKFEIIGRVKIYRITVPHKGERYWFSLFAIPKAIKIGAWADIIHTTTYTAALPAFISSKINKKKSIITVHEVLLKLWHTIPINKFYSLIYYYSEKILVSLKFSRYICVSNYTKNCLKLLRIPEKKLTMIYNGLDYSLLKPEKGTNVKKDLKLENSFVGIYYGRLGVTKGIEYLLQSFKEIKKEIKNFKLILILPKKPSSRYRNILNFIKKNGLIKDIILFESLERTKLFSYIKTSDCVIIPSLSEGFGFCVAETSYLTTPMVVSNTGSIPEIISGKYVLVEPKNPLSIAEGVIRINKKKYKNTKIKKFKINDTVKKYIEEYEK